MKDVNGTTVNVNDHITCPSLGECVIVTYIDAGNARIGERVTVRNLQNRTTYDIALKLAGAVYVPPGNDTDRNARTTDQKYGV